MHPEPPSFPPPSLLLSRREDEDSGRVKTCPETPSFSPSFLPADKKTRDSGRVSTRPEPPSFPPSLLPSSFPPSLQTRRRGLWMHFDASRDSLLLSFPPDEKTRDSGRVKTHPEPPSFPLSLLLSLLPPCRQEDEGLCPEPPSFSLDKKMRDLGHVKTRPKPPSFPPSLPPC